jgi:hypothetical protein
MYLRRDVGLFGTGTRTNVLTLLSILGESHLSEMARVLGTNVTTVVKAVDSLEQVGVVASVQIGRARRVSLNPRYPFMGELKPLLGRMASSNPALLEAVSTLRRRPRRKGKEL